MKVDEIRISAQLTSGLQISDVVGLKWVAEAVQDICTNYNNAGKRIKEPISITDANTDYQIVSPLLKLINLTDSKTGKEPVYTLNSDNTITFKENGDYTLEYLAMPTLPTNVNDTVPLPQFFIPSIQYYLAYKIRGRLFGQSDANAAGFFQQYQSENAKGELARQRQGKKRQIPARRY